MYDTEPAIRAAPDAAPANEQLDHAVLTEVIHLCLWAGTLLMEHGADSQRVEETVCRIGRALGADDIATFVSANALIVTVSSGSEFRTRTARVGAHGINMTMVSAINRLSRRIEVGELERTTVRSELARISSMPQHYNRFLVVGMVGLGCFALCRLAGGDWSVCGVTFMASALAMLVRQELTRRSVNIFLVVIVTAFIAGLLASSAVWLQLGERPQLALATSVLLLVPGIPMINAVEDMITGHAVVGVARGVTAALIALAIALGLALAMRVAGVEGL